MKNYFLVLFYTVVTLLFVVSCLILLFSLVCFLIGVATAPLWMLIVSVVLIVLILPMYISLQIF